MKKFYLMTMLSLVCLLVAESAVAQNTVKGAVKGTVTGSRTITGTVVDPDSGEPLIGVNVVVAGTTIGATTDIDGKYELDVPDRYSELEFSYIGYQVQTVAIEGASNIMDINLEEDALMLDAVVTTAIGISRSSKELGYAVQQVGGDAITRSQEPNVIQGLSGKVAGVQVIGAGGGTPGGSSYIRIRGNTSITGSSQPLIVVDGVPMNNDQNSGGNPDDGSNNLLDGVAQSNRAIDINPDDVESMSVLKGAAASALYGIDGANGVIVITTKKGKSSKGKGLNVTFNSSITVDNINKFPELQDTYTQGSGGAIQLPETGQSGSWGPNIADLSYDGDQNYAYDQNGRLVFATDEAATGEAAKVYDNVGDFFQTGRTYNNSLSVSGGSDVANFRLSFGHTQQNGIVPLSDFKRTSVRLTGQSKLSNQIKFSGSINYINSGGNRIQQGSNTSGIMLGLLRTPISFDNSNASDGVNNSSSYLFEDGSQRNYRGGGGYDNPYWVLNQIPFQDKVDRALGFVQLDFLPLDWLSITYRLGNDFYIDRRTQSFAAGSNTLSGGQFYNDSHFNHILNSDLLISATRQLGRDLEASFLIGQNARRDLYQRHFSQSDGKLIDGFEHISNGATFLVRETTSERVRAAVFGEAKLAYKRMLYLNFTGRNEWSSTLPEANRSFFYPSASVGFIFTEALGLTDNPILPFGKLRFSYAEVGKDASVYATKTVFTQSSFADGWTNGVSYPFLDAPGFSEDNVLGNPELKPEKTREFEIGADLRFLGGRVGLDVSYYNKRTDDVIVNIPISASTGYTNFIGNVASIENKGIELALTTTPIKYNGFQWDATMNFTRNRNEVLSLAEGVSNVFLNGFSGTASRAVAGEAHGVIFGGQWLRDDQGRLVIENDPNNAFYGYPVADPNTGVIGDPNPDWLMGIRNTLSYKGFSISGLIDIKHGGDLWNGTAGALTFFGRSQLTENRGQETVVYEGVLGTLDDDDNLVTNGETNNVAVVPDQAWFQGNGGGFGAVDEHFIEDASYVRLRELSLSYSLSPSLIKRTPFRGIDISVTGRNVFLLTNYSGIDPDTNLTGASSGQGLDYFQMPNTRGWTVGLKLRL